MQLATTLPYLPPAASTPIGGEVLRGLTARQKKLAPWMFYDRRGSELFEAITELPEYYLTRTEREILAEHADAIVKATASEKLAIFELGAGTAAKTRLLLEAAVRRQRSVTYYPIDISEFALEQAKTRLAEEVPQVTVEPLVRDYTRAMGELPEGLSGVATRRLVLYIGSSIGNFEPAAASALLKRLRRRLKAGDWLLLGVDHLKDRTTLLRAYNDGAGVTAEFNRNVLARINAELGATFRPRLFRHRAMWNDRECRVEMHLESLVAQEVGIPALDLHVAFRRGESIHTENSYKFTPESATGLLERAGFATRRDWTDARRWFGVYLAEAV